jgi:hypothetical protein
MINYPTLPPTFDIPCISAIEKVNEELGGNKYNIWFYIDYSEESNRLVIKLDSEAQKTRDLINSPRLSSYLATQLLNNCPIQSVDAEVYDFSFPTWIDPVFRYVKVNGLALDVGICLHPESEFPFFCDEL